MAWHTGTADAAASVPNRIHLPTSDEPEFIESFRSVAAISVTALLSRDRAYACPDPYANGNGWLLNFCL